MTTKNPNTSASILYYSTIPPTVNRLFCFGLIGFFYKKKKTNVHMKIK